MTLESFAAPLLVLMAVILAVAFWRVIHHR